MVLVIISVPTLRNFLETFQPKSPWERKSLTSGSRRQLDSANRFHRSSSNSTLHLA